MYAFLLRNKTRSREWMTAPAGVGATDAATTAVTVRSALCGSVDLLMCCQPLPFRQLLPHQQPMNPSLDATSGIFVGQISATYDHNDITAILCALCRPHPLDIRSIKMHRNKSCVFVELNRSAIPYILQFHRRLYCDHDCVWIAPTSELADFITRQLHTALSNFPAKVRETYPRKFIVLESCVSRTLHPERSLLPSQHDAVSFCSPPQHDVDTANTSGGETMRPPWELPQQRRPAGLVGALLKQLAASIPQHPRYARLRRRLNTDLSQWHLCSRCMRHEVVPFTTQQVCGCCVCDAVVLAGAKVKQCLRCDAAVHCVGCA
jgi:hypothetical protein